MGGKCVPLLGTWAWQYYVRPFLCVLLYPIYSEQLISPVCWPLSPLHNTLVWAAPGGYLFLHVIALSCLHTTLRTNYPRPARGRDSYLPIQSFKTNYPVTGEKINKKEAKTSVSALLQIFVGKYKYLVTKTSAPIWGEMKLINYLSFSSGNGDGAEDIIRTCRQWFYLLAHLHRSIKTRQKKKTLCGNRFGKRRRWRC